jgi:hypothetical protein
MERLAPPTLVTHFSTRNFLQRGRWTIPDHDLLHTENPVPAPQYELSSGLTAASYRFLSPPWLDHSCLTCLASNTSTLISDAPQSFLVQKPSWRSGFMRQNIAIRFVFALSMWSEVFSSAIKGRLESVVVPTPCWPFFEACLQPTAICRHLAPYRHPQETGLCR